jgi:hypothetical protein
MPAPRAAIDSTATKACFRDILFIADLSGAFYPKFAKTPRYPSDLVARLDGTMELL